MEDRYLFRGKRIDTGEWIVGSLLVDKQQDIDTGEQIEITGIYPSEYKDFAKKIDPTTICQCTGIRDKTGKLIWENDIVKYRIYQRTEQLYKVIYDYEEGSWSLGCNSEPLYSIGGANSEKCEVVGNAFDNPELLEV